MPETPDPEGTEPEDGSVGNRTIQQMRKEIDDLKKAAKAGEVAQKERDEAMAELSGFKRAAAFDRLNIPATGPGKLFREAYQGELTDEAIVAKATEYDLIKPTNPNAPTIPGIDQDAFARQMASLQGTQSSAQPQAPQAAIVGAPDRESLLKVLTELGVRDPESG